MSPNAPKTPVSNFRIPLEVKQPAQEKAADRGETLTDVVVRALALYVSSDVLDRPTPSAPSSPSP